MNRTKPITKRELSGALVLEQMAGRLESIASTAIPLQAFALRAAALEYRYKALIQRRVSLKEIKAHLGPLEELHK